MAESAVARGTVFALRREIARIEGRPAERLEPARPAGSSTQTETPFILRRNGVAAAGWLETGAVPLDAALGGGLPLAALTEIHACETRNAGAAAGFVLALVARIMRRQNLPLLWIGTSEVFREAGLPYAPGLARDFGIDPERLLVSEAPKLVDALWVAEEAARLPALSAVIVEMRGNPQKLDLVATRRLHRRAQDAGRPVFLLRQAARAEPSAAPVRLVIAPAPAAERRILSGALGGSIGPPAFTVAIAKSRSGIPAQFTLEWNADECAFHERRRSERPAPNTGLVVSLSTDRANPAPKAGQVLAFKGAA